MGGHSSYISLKPTKSTTLSKRKAPGLENEVNAQVPKAAAPL